MGQLRRLCVSSPTVFTRHALLRNSSYTLGSSVAFPALQQLQLGATVANLSLLSGTLPATWGPSEAFQQLETLRLNNCSIRGTQQHLMAMHTSPLTDGRPSFAKAEAFIV